MATSKKTPDYRQLSIAERLELVEDIWDSIAADAGTIPVPAGIIKEAERRLAEHRRDLKPRFPGTRSRRIYINAANEAAFELSEASAGRTL
jgi:putative addiction module component (TIGR02574 family)